MSEPKCEACEKWAMRNSYMTSAAVCAEEHHALIARERERAENEHEMLKEQIDLVHRLKNAIQDVLKLAQTGTPERTWLIARLKESER